MKVYIFFIFLSWTLIFPHSTLAQIISTQYNNNIKSQVQVYHVHDFIFKGNIESSDNPFDVTFGAVYTGPEGEKMKIPGFYN